MKRRDNQSSAGQPETEAVQTALASLDWAVTRGSAGRIAHNFEVRRTRRRRRVLAGATLLSGALIAGTLVWSPWTRTVALREAAPPAGSSIVVSPQTESLPDGSVVELKPGARFRVEFEPAMRRVVLEAGEAHFAVCHEAARQFVVAAGAVEVRAVGTAFAVDYAQRSVAVLVTEGRVAVVGPADPQSGGAAERPTELVEAGQRAVVELGDAERGAAAKVLVTAETAAAERLAWRLRRLEFSNTRLAQAIPAFNRHAGTRLSLDPTLGALRVSGSLRADDLDALLLLLRSDFGIVTEPQPDGTVALRRP